MATDSVTRDAQENGNEGRREERRTSLWSRFRNLSQRGGMRASRQDNVTDNTAEESCSKPAAAAAETAVLGHIVEKSTNEEVEKKKKSPPRLKDEDDVNESDKKPAAKVKGVQSKEEFAVVPVTMDEAKYSTERMQKALKKLGRLLLPEPADNASGELDSVFESNFKIREESSAKDVVKMMRSNSEDLSPEFKLLTVTAFRNACLQSKDVTNVLLEVESPGLMIGGRIMEIWKYEAMKNLEHLATTVGSDDKNWFHQVTASFLVMECLKFIWDRFVTDKREELFDKKKQLELLHEQYGLEWGQDDYLSDVKECGLAIGADAIVKACDTNIIRHTVIMSSREMPKSNYNAASSRSRGVNGPAIAIRPRPVRSAEDIRRDRERRERRMERNNRRREEMLAARARNDQDAGGAMVNVHQAQPNNDNDQGLNRAMVRVDEHPRAFMAGMDEHFRAMARMDEHFRAFAMFEMEAGHGVLFGGAPRNDERPRPGARVDRNAVNGETRQNGDVGVNNNERFEESNSRAEGAPVVAASGNPPGLNDGETGASNNQRSAQSNGRTEAAGDARRDADGEEPPMRNDEESAVNNGNVEQQGVGSNQAEGPRAVRDVALEPGRDGRATVDAEGAERRARDVRRNLNEDFPAAVARAPLPHLVEERRALLMARALRTERGFDHPFALERQLEMEHELHELIALGGPPVSARRRLMIAQRAMRDGRLDILEALDELDDFDTINYLEALEHGHVINRGARPTVQPPRGLARREPSEPSVPAYLKELRDFEACAKTEPFDITEGLELVKPCQDFDAEAVFIKRVTACVGWAIHGLIFELVDGTRMGTLLVNPGDKPMELMDKNLASRNCVGWTDVEYGDFIVGMHGDRLSEGTQKWFCYSLVLEFASGKTISYEANHELWRGEPFSFDVPRTHPCFVHRISFKNDQEEDMLGLVTSIHLPLSRANLPYLPRKQQQAVEELLEIGKGIDWNLETHGGLKPMGEDVWWRILGFIRGWELLPPSPNVKGSKNGQRLFDLYARRHEYRIQS